MKWKRTATGVVAVAALAVTAVAVSASDSTLAMANSTIGPKLPPPSGPLTRSAPRPFLSTGTGSTTGVLVTASGQALYFNDQDTLVTSACVATCAQVWRPLLTPAHGAMSVGPDVTGALSTIRRPDGTSQVTYDGHALYTYTVDAIGHATGNGLIDSYDGRAYSWHAIAASGAALPSAPPSVPTLPTPGLSGTPVIPGPSGIPTPGQPTPGQPTPGQPTPTPTPALNPTVRA
jgi:predicted lipoprotein with Yx(FWY)xxD motif